MPKSRGTPQAPVVRGNNYGVVANTIEGPVAAGNQATSFQTVTSAPAEQASDIATIRIFLASSVELKSDRDQFDLYFRQLNDEYRRENIYIEIARWENAGHALSRTRKQDDYNRELAQCDVFVSLFCTKVGRFTEEEFDVALQHYQRVGRPLIYTFFKSIDATPGSAGDAGHASVRAFQNKLATLGHFWSEYTTIEDLQVKFRRQLDRILSSEDWKSARG